MATAKSTASKSRHASSAKTVKTSNNKRNYNIVDPELRNQMISEAAYFIALNRNFHGEYCVEDWLQAEKQIDKQFKEPLIRLAWRGNKTIDIIPKLLDVAEQVEIILPVGFNHALFRALNPDLQAATNEDIDITGGPELLAKIAKIKGLEHFEALIEVLNRNSSTIQIVSPPMVIITRA